MFMCGLRVRNANNTMLISSTADNYVMHTDIIESNKQLYAMHGNVMYHDISMLPRVTFDFTILIIINL